MRKSLKWLLVVGLLASGWLAGSLNAFAQHPDVIPYGLNGKIVTGSHDDVLGTDVLEQLVYGYDFGEDPTDPYIIGDPGFNNGGFAVGVFPNDGLLPTFSTLAFDVVTQLFYWDGTGSVNFGPAPANVLLGLNRGSNTGFVDGAGNQTGTWPTIQPTGAAGRVHEHLDSELHFTDGTNPAAPNAPDGIYYIGMQLKLIPTVNSNGTLLNSDPIYIVYNNGLSEEIHEAAEEWIQTNVVPEPGTWSLIALATVAGAWGFRRRSM
ncbi:MAG: PEP-CTERM sorting domain-containing protein [Pirellulales bacterium]|nr:PEP-CTERM sorting domain-containing protein [Pirellulales bacterium]